MKKAPRFALLASLLTLFLGTMGLAYGATRFEAAAWQEACELSRYSCDDMERPLVSYDETSLVDGIWGYYLIGTSVVFLSEGLPVDQAYAVLVHEMVHYIQYRDWVATGRKGNMGKCDMEREAFEVSDQVLKRLGLDELARNGDLTNYGC